MPTLVQIILRARPDNKVTAYASLAKCGVKFITTNYDSLLFQALEGLTCVSEAVKDLKVESDSKAEVKTVEKTDSEIVHFFGDPAQFDRTKLLRNKVVFHLHGSINDEKTIVSSTMDYLRLYASDSVRSFLSWFFENNVVVFLGYGLEELELLDLIVRSGGQGSTENPFRHPKTVGDLFKLLLIESSTAPAWPQEKVREISQSLLQHGEKNAMIDVCRIYSERSPTCEPIRDICAGIGKAL